jgi:hypothetical protein
MFCAIAALRRDSCKRALDFCSSQLVPKSRLTIKFYSVTSGARRRRFWELLQPPLGPFVSTVATSPFHSKPLNERNRLWLLKNSIFLEIAEIWGIENVYEKRERRL